ncbi:MAG: HAD family phosphatase [Thermoanaerobacteraceae bacterium]|nr:HAD family phosphatase [Thermoanaerobacteraceae bacterium]
MTIKLIALDIDGTIVDSDNNISPANEKAIREVISRGIPVALVTGRHRDGTKKVINEVGLDINIPLVLNNGALVYLGGDIVWKDFLSVNEADAVIKFTTKIPGVVTTIYQTDDIHLHCNSPIDRDWLIDRLKAFEINCSKVANTPDELTREDVAKIMLITESSEKALKIFQMWPEELSNLKCTRSYPYLGEINSSTCDKGRGLKVLCEKLGILPEEVLAVGDGENDVPMFTFAKHAVFVRHDDYIPNLPPHVAVTPKGYHNEGVAWAISKMVLGV